MSRKRKRLSRRRFLRAAASAAAAPYVLTSAALGGASAPPAGDRIGLGIVGTGRQGFEWVQAVRRLTNVRVAGLAEVDSKKLNYALTYIQRYPGGKDCTGHKDFRELLGRDDVDAVVVATPDHWHAVIAIQAVKSAKDVYCESPLSLTIREARAMVTAGRRYGRIVQAGTRYRSSAAYRTGCELVRSGRIGAVKTVHVQAGTSSRRCYLGAQPAPATLDWDMWLGPAPWAPYHAYRCGGSSSSYGWRAWRDYSGGYVACYGAHYFDAIQWALGTDETGPVEVVPADAQKKTPLTFRYANGVELLNTRGPHEAVIEFTGTNGALALGVGKAGYQTWPDDLAKEPPGPGDVKLPVSDNYLGDFLGCIKSRRRPVSDVAAAARSVTISHLAGIATWLGRALKWDPAAERFVGDAQADRWLDRPRRGPWRL